MAFKGIAEAKQFCKLYALAKKVELVVVKSDKKRLRAYLDAVCKTQAVDNNFTESFNAWILEARNNPIIEMLEDVRVKIMERLAAKEVVVRKWKDDGFSPKSELFIEYLKISKVCKVSGNGDNGYEAKQGKKPTKKQGKQPAKQGKETGRGKKSYFLIAEDDDEDPRLRQRTISEEAFLIRLRKRQNPQEPIGSRAIGFSGDKFGVSEPTNLPIVLTGLTWNRQGAVNTNQL
ncbi:hypothetical protein RDI58_026747 [Solanum bulbocastanum]|uniref:Uncharacterized protein n=1 Tax=Solanum bulbocastanum TaxID=147425 RepID=A0AAN8T240_SOLBU